MGIKNTKTAVPLSCSDTAVAALFSCTLCCGCVEAPVMQCKAGHLLCAKCCLTWRCRSKCPTCGAPLKPRIRNFALEQVASILGLPSESCSGAATDLISAHEEELKAQFVCPVCYEYVLRPTLQCRAGHLVCIDCWPWMTDCPICRVPLRPDMMNVGMEALAEMVPTLAAILPPLFEPDPLADYFPAAGGGGGPGQEQTADPQDEETDVGDRRASLPVALEPEHLPSGAAEAPATDRSPSRWTKVCRFFARIPAAVSSRLHWVRVGRV